MASNSPVQPQQQDHVGLSATMLFVWLIAVAVAFLPFAVNTSAWDAVTFRVPGNQGNWWHFLASFPFFLAFPMIWLRLRQLRSRKAPSLPPCRTLWAVAILSMLGTAAVETPFLLHLAGTSQWQQFIVLALGFGILLSSALLLVLRRRYIPPIRACAAGLSTAYLANAALCLVVYSEAAGPFSSRSGWFLCLAIVWPIGLDLLWTFIQSFQASRQPLGSAAGRFA